MSNFPLATLDTADEIAKPILENFKKNYGMIPNFFGALGIDGTSLDAYLTFENKITDSTFLTNEQQELISLAVANQNGCHYCVSGHTFSAKKAGLSAEICLDAQKGINTDPKNQIILNIALNILKNSGKLNEAILKDAAEHGITPEQVIQIAIFTALNTFSNWVNNIVDPTIDFPKVDLISTP